MNGEREMAPEANRAEPLHVLVVGCGLGGLACAIGCCREGLRVTVLEQASELAEVCITKISHLTYWRLTSRDRSRNSNTSQCRESDDAIWLDGPSHLRRPCHSFGIQSVFALHRWRGSFEQAGFSLG